MGYLIVLAIIAGIAYGITVKLRSNFKESAINQRISKELSEKQISLDKRNVELNELESRLAERDAEFKAGFLRGRKWLSEMIAEADSSLDLAREEYLRYKIHPAAVAAKIVSQIKTEKRELKGKLKFLEFQIKSYEEYFPFLEEYRDFILDEKIPLSADQDNQEAIESADPALQHISKEEHEQLSISERNQLALDRYISKNKNNWEIGRMYERYIGFLRESSGWKVEYHGALRGYEDFGRDLICKNGQITEIIQAKCWSRHKEIHEKHLFQLFGTCIHYKLEHSNFWVTPVFVTTTTLSKAAEMVAEALGIRVEYTQLSKTYPMIKCNINPSTLEKIYHLPFDQQYDRAIIGAVKGECYVETVSSAESLGFRRAWRWRATQEIIAQT